jgi:hypothetical protein
MSKATIQYEVVSLPSNRERLSPQLLALVTTIDFLKEEIDGKQVIDRDKVYLSWLADIEMETNDKVFASYIHQLIQFAFLDRMNVKPKKEQTVEELKKMIEKQMKLLKQAEKTAELLDIETTKGNDKLKFKLDVAEAEEELV